MQKKTRAKELLEQSRLPFTSDQSKKLRRSLSAVDLANLKYAEHSFRPKTNGYYVPNFNRIHSRFVQSMEEKKRTRSPTRCKPFLLYTNLIPSKKEQILHEMQNDVERRLAETRQIKGKPIPSHAVSVSISSEKSESIPTKMTEAQRLRESLGKQKRRDESLKVQSTENLQRSRSARERRVPRRTPSANAVQREGNSSQSQKGRKETRTSQRSSRERREIRPRLGRHARTSETAATDGRNHRETSGDEQIGEEVQEGFGDRPSVGRRTDATADENVTLGKTVFALVSNGFLRLSIVRVFPLFELNKKNLVELSSRQKSIRFRILIDTRATALPDCLRIDVICLCFSNEFDRQILQSNWKKGSGDENSCSPLSGRRFCFFFFFSDREEKKKTLPRFSDSRSVNVPLAVFSCSVLLYFYLSFFLFSPSVEAMHIGSSSSTTTTLPLIMSTPTADADDKIKILPAADKSSTIKSKSDEILQSLTFRAMIVFQVIAYGSYSVLVHLCEKDGVIAFSSAMMNFILEFVKLLFSLCALLSATSDKNAPASPVQTSSLLRQSLPYAIPGILYFLNNNLAVHMQLHMDPASYQMLSNFKIVTTAILYRLIIKQKLSRQQWFAITLLFLGGFIYSIGE